MGRILFSILLLAIAIALFVVFVKPRSAHIKELRAEQAELKSAVTSGNALRERREELTKQYNALPAADLTRLETLLPDSIDNVKLILDLDALARTHNLPLKNVRVIEASRENKSNQEAAIDGEEEVPGYNIVRLELSVEGPYERLVTFLSEIEASLRLIDIESISFSSSDVSSTYTYLVQLRTYWLR